MADAQVLGDLAQAELVRRSVDQAVEGRLEEPRLQPILVAGCRFGHPHHRLTLSTYRGYSGLTLSTGGRHGGTTHDRDPGRTPRGPRGRRRANGRAVAEPVHGRALVGAARPYLERGSAPGGRQRPRPWRQWRSRSPVQPPRLRGRSRAGSRPAGGRRCRRLGGQRVGRARRTAVRRRPAGGVGAS